MSLSVCVCISISSPLPDSKTILWCRRPKETLPKEPESIHGNSDKQTNRVRVKTSIRRNGNIEKSHRGQVRKYREIMKRKEGDTGEGSSSDNVALEKHRDTDKERS